MARMLRLELGEGHDWPWNDRVAEARRLSCKTAILATSDSSGQIPYSRCVSLYRHVICGGLLQNTRDGISTLRRGVILHRPFDLRVYSGDENPKS